MYAEYKRRMDEEIYATFMGSIGWENIPDPNNVTISGNAKTPRINTSKIPTIEYQNL